MHDCEPARLDDNAAACGLVIDPALFAKAVAIAAAIRMAPSTAAGGDYTAREREAVLCLALPR